jgi:hypothetical protein
VTGISHIVNSCAACRVHVERYHSSLIKPRETTISYRMTLKLHEIEIRMAEP